MCDVCMHNPCLSGCPEAQEPEEVATCVRCENPILVGDEYANIDGTCYCERCLEDMPLCVLVETLGGDWLVAKKLEIQEVTLDEVSRFFSEEL